MKKKVIIITMLAVFAGTAVTGCRSRITASSEADEIRNAEDALASSDQDSGLGQWIRNSMTEFEENQIQEQEEQTEPQTETETETETQEIPEVTTAAQETAEEENNVDDTDKKQPLDESDKEYLEDERNHGDDILNSESSNKTNKGAGSASGNGDGGGNGGKNNGGNAPGIGLSDPTEPPVTQPAEEPPDPQNDEQLPSEEDPTQNLPEIYVTVSFEAAGGNINDSRPREIKVGEQYGELPVCSRSGFTFAGWFTGENGNGIRIDENSVVSIEEDHTLYAFYVQREIHNVHFVNEGVRGNFWIGNSAEENRQVYVGDSYGSPFPTPVTRSGYTFLGWYDAPEGGNRISNTDIFTANTDVELYAHMDYDPLPYWIGILNNVNGYPCQNLGTICEYDEPNVPIANSLFIARLGRGPVQAADNSTIGMTTEEIIKAKPNTRVMIKIISDIGSAEAVAAEALSRYPVTYPYQNRALYIIPAEAESGDPAVTLVYNLAIKMQLWPESFEKNTALNPWGLEALDKAVEELGVAYPTIVHYGY